VVHPIYDDPRIAPVRPLLRAKDHAGAAEAFAVGRGQAFGTPFDLCAWDYAQGRVLQASEQWAPARVLLERVGASVGGPSTDAACVLAPHAKLHLAQIELRLGEVDAAMAHLRELPEALMAREEAQAILAEILAKKGDAVGAVAVFRRVLATSPRGPRWIEWSLRLANALLDGTVGTPESGAAEAYALATRVIVEAPQIADSSSATAVRRRAFAVLRGKEFEGRDALSEAERTRQAQAYLDSGEVTRAMAVASSVLMRRPTVADADTLCKAATLRAQAMAKSKASSADAWSDALHWCEKSDGLATVLYSSGKLSMHDRRSDEALGRFALLEQRFPTHYLADDARFLRGVLLAEAGEDAKAEEQWASILDGFPQGDMGLEGLFRVALARMTRGDWAGAKAPLERIEATARLDHHWATAGRASYFLGRIAAATGDDDGARRAYKEVLRSHPLTFYMAQAYARLAAMDRDRAKNDLSEALAQEDAEAPLFPKGFQGLSSDSFRRGLALLEVDEFEAAKKEFADAGAAGENAVPEIAWTVSYLLNAVGRPDMGHALHRSKRTEHLAHYPVGRYRLPWLVAFPKAYESLVLEESRRQGVPPALTWAVIREESGFIPEAKSGANAFGLMQIIPPTARSVARGTGLPTDEASLKRPEVSIALGTKFLSQLRNAYGTNPHLAIAAYNGGGGSVGKWLNARGSLDFDLWVESIPFEETRGYIKRVLASELAYAYLYDRESLEQVLTIPFQVRSRGI
jgi:soluble lytic murein transglycosylase